MHGTFGKKDLTEQHNLNGLINMMNLKECAEKWSDDPESHLIMHEGFKQLTDLHPYLKAHRDWVEKNIFGFGDRSFHYMWKLIIDDMPKAFVFMEIGVFRGQVLSLVQQIASYSQRYVTRYGVTPLTSAGGHWESDYREDIIKMHNQFHLPLDYILFEGLSTDSEIIKQVQETVNPLDILYIDGGHSLDVVRSDLKNYLPLVKKGGILVVDDAANLFNMPHGIFPGIAEVSQAISESLPPFTDNPDFEFMFNVGHNLVYKKV